MSAYTPAYLRFHVDGRDGRRVKGGHKEARHALTWPGRRLLLTFVCAERRKIERRRGLDGPPQSELELHCPV